MCVLSDVLYINLSCLFILIHIPGLSVYSQEDIKQSKDNFLYAEYYLSNYQYHEALPFYLSVYHCDSLNANINYKMGKCYINIRGLKLKSIPYLERAAKNISTRYIKGKFESDEAPIETLILLGEAYQRNNQLDMALQAYQAYKDMLEAKDKKNIKIAEMKIQSVYVAKQELKDSASYIWINLGSNINSRFSDYNPVVPDNEDLIIFTSFWESADLIFQAYNNNGEWTTPVDITDELGSGGDCYTGALTGNGKELYLIKQGNFNSDIYVSYLTDNKWSVMKKLNKKINSNNQETSISVSPEGDAIYFSSNRPGGEGGFDIYKSLKKNGEWEKPVNLGKTINTPYNEEAPYITGKGKILFFSSEGHKNMGGMDIFYSEPDGYGIWSEPVNLGYPINTTNDDLFFVYSESGETSYFSRFDPNGYGKHDIIKLKVKLRNIIKKNTAYDVADKDDFADLNTTSDDFMTTSAPYMVTPDSNQKYNEKALYNEEIPYYTIQIMALSKPVSTSYFTNLDNVKVHTGDDLINRYTYGKYFGYTLARQYLEEICKLGYTDAFIREINSIPNYNESP